MNLSNLKPAEGSVKHSKRNGRGAVSGKGGTSTRGNKGAKARSGYHQKVGFEGGQMPLYRRVPKFGFKNINRIEYVGINLDTLNTLAWTCHNLYINHTLPWHNIIVLFYLLKLILKNYKR